MNVERWKRRSSSGLALSTPATACHDVTTNPTEIKAPRVLTRAFRSLSSSSMESITASSTRSNSTRRLQKTPSSNSSSMLDRLQRKVSNSSPASDRSCSPIDQLLPYPAMDVLHCGPLKTDVSLLKARSEYLVLSDQVLVRFSSGDAARTAFPQLNPSSPQSEDGPVLHQRSSKVSSSDIRLEIVLRSVVAAFIDDAANNRHGIEIWWFSPWPRLAYSKAHFFFSLAKERDAWLAAIHRASRAKSRQTTGGSLLSDSLISRIDHIIKAAEGPVDVGQQGIIFPVARRVFGQKSNGTEDAPDNTDISTFFLVIGPCMCHFIEVLKADHATAPGDLRVKAVSYGTVTLTRFKASVASHEHRFIMCFRSPFGRESRIDLASCQYRRIIETLTKADRNLKPMWPQHFQQVIFDVRGLPPPLQLTSGNDLGGLKRSLEAYCAAYQVEVPNWTIEWSPPPQPAFRLLPSSGPVYKPLQLLAVFRALRYNSFFKAISFRGVDLSPLAGRMDKSQYGDSLAYKSLNGVTISEDYHELLLQSTVLEQEVHALLFASESIRSLDISNVLGLKSKNSRLSRLQCDLESLRRTTYELLRPFLELLRRQMCICNSIFLSGNPISVNDMEELANTLSLDHVHIRRIDLSKCSLGDTGLSKLWASLGGQADLLEWIDTSNNQGVVRFETMKNALRGMRRLSKLKIAGNTQISSDESLFDSFAMQRWELQELDLSGIMLNAASVDSLVEYLKTDASRSLQSMRLNNTGLTGSQVSQLFKAMGQARPMEVHVNGSRMDDGIDDLCAAIAAGYGPWCLFAQMVEFAVETNYVKFIRALTVNESIQCLSLAGTSTPDAASSATCQSIADFLAHNCCLRLLDISGYDSKLDEGRLGREFSKALIGLRANKSIEHLRVRNQMLNLNIGDLAEALSENKSLRTLDCEGNDFNISNYRHLVTALEANSTVHYFSAFSADELSKALTKSLEAAAAAAPARKASIITRFKSDKPTNGTTGLMVQRLRAEWEGVGAELERILQRNRSLFGQEMVAEQSDSSSQDNCRSSPADTALCSSFGGLSLQDAECQRSRGARLYPDSPPTPSGEFGPRRHSRQSSLGSRDLMIRTASVLSIDVAVSPSTDEASNGSGDACSPPQFGSPVEQDFGLATPSFDDHSEGNYTCSDGYEVDDGIQMKRYRRYMGDPTSRIEEEDG